MESTWNHSALKNWWILFNLFLQGLLLVVFGVKSNVKVVCLFMTMLKRWPRLMLVHGGCVQLLNPGCGVGIYCTIWVESEYLFWSSEKIGCIIEESINFCDYILKSASRALPRIWMSFFDTEEAHAVMRDKNFLVRTHTMRDSALCVKPRSTSWCCGGNALARFRHSG